MVKLEFGQIRIGKSKQISPFPQSSLFWLWFTLALSWRLGFRFPPEIFAFSCQSPLESKLNCGCGCGKKPQTENPTDFQGFAVLQTGFVVDTKSDASGKMG